MRFRRAIAAALALVAVAALVPPPAHAQVAPRDEVVALLVQGVGNGHGRGMSQWGAYGRAVNGRHSWQQILGSYYGGTVLGSVATTSRVRVRLVGLDNATMIGVVSVVRRAIWNGVSYGALQARQTSPGLYDVYAAATPACPSSTTTGWTRVAVGVRSPIRFTTNVSETAAAAGDVLGLCTGPYVVHYRGVIEVTKDNTGAPRVVNDVATESYLRGVVSREVSTSWGNAGSGAGMNALRAQAVAARSFALASNRYASSGGYAITCDTTVCQAYGGAARRVTPTTALVAGVTCEAGNATFECANTNRAIAETAGRVLRWPDGRIAVTEFSASNGPVTAGGTFPSIADPYDNVPANPNHRWVRIIDADQLEVAYGLGSMIAATTEPDPGGTSVGIWDNRVRLRGTKATMVVSTLAIRSAFGLPSHGYTVSGITRSRVVTSSMRFIGDGVGRSVSENANAELPALLDGVYATASYDTAFGRCTSGCGISGVGAAASVPVGTGTVIVHLGYAAPNDNFAARIDALMNALVARGVRRVVWINLAERSGRADFAAVNRALAAAPTRWPQLTVLDWRASAAGTAADRNRWFTSDGHHLTATGQAQFARFIRDRIVLIAT
jgi:peptidoglycan hydrolase-like amidase